MRPDHDLPAGAGKPYGGVPSVVYNPPPSPPDPERSARWAKRRMVAYIIVTVILGIIVNRPEADASAAAYTDPYAQARAEGYAAGQIIGGGVGLLVVSYVIAALFLGWSGSTRKRIPGAAFVLAMVSLLGSALNQAGTNAQPEGAQQLTGGPGTVQAPENDPPAGNGARRDWATRRAGDDMQAHIVARAAHHGVDPQAPPAGWLSAAYLADPGKHGHVPEHFTRYRRFLQELDTTLVSVFIDATQVRLRQSGLGEPQVERIMAEVREEMDQEAPAIRRESESELALVSAALDLHAYLERIDPRVHLDEAAGAARFARESERTRAFQLVDEVRRSAIVVDSLKAARRARLASEESGP